MKNYTRILTILLLALLTFVLSATAQTSDNKNKAIVETTDGTQQLNADDISIIRFEGDKVTFVQPWGESVFDRTLRSLTFLRPLPGTLRLTVNAGINENQGNRAQDIDGDGKLRTTWASGDKVYVYADATSTTSIGTLTPSSYGSNSATLTGDVDATGLSEGNHTLYFSTKPRPFNFTSQDGTVESLFYFTATADITVVGANASLSGNLNFTRPVAIVKFSMKDGVGSAINVNSLTISAASNKLVRGYSATPTYHSGYTITANSIGYEYSSGFDPVGQLLDGDINTKWCARKGEHTGSDNWYVEFNTTSAIQVDGYTLVTGGDTDEYPGRNPKDWTLQAKLLDTDDWTTIATVTNDSRLEGKKLEAYNYTVTTPGVYQYFRFEISSNQNYDGEYIMQLSEFKLWKNGDIAPAYGDVTVTPTIATNELFVALRNENGSADTYTLAANGGGANYIYNKSGVDFAYNSYYAINVKMSSPLAASNITVITGNQGTSFPLGYGYVYDKLLDGNKSTKWCSLTQYAGSYASRVASTGKDMVMWKTASSVVMTGYILTTGDDTQNESGRNWKSWTIYGGNFADDDAAQSPSAVWTVIQQVENDNVLEGINSKDYYYFMNNTTAYQYYKVVIDDIQSTTDNIQQMGEFTMLTKNAAPDLAHSTPLTFEAKADGFTVTLTSNLDPLPSLEYSIDGGAWTDFTFSGDIATTPSVNTGQTIAFRGDNTRFFYFDHDTHFSNFSCSQDCYLYGNMMSLLSADSYAMNTSVGEYAFCRLFKDNTHIYSHDTKQLALPATTLARSCYESLFQDCTHLTTAPNLPATTLATTCYNNMFSGCTGLVNAPEISATTLAYLCCANMFDGCTSLTTGPTLSATTLDDYCYYYMFKGCTSLNSVTCLATNISAENCTDNWLYGVAATGTFTAANNTVAWSEGTSGIPSGWTKVYPAPSGATKGLFSVSSTKQVYFSQGNLQAVGTTSSSPSSGWTWQFAEHQWDYIGGRSDGGSEDQTGNNYINGNGSLSANGTVDLFCWSTNATYYGIHNSSDNSTYSGDFYDWGNAIGDGWRTLTNAEWDWIMGPLENPTPGTNCRTSSTVNGVENARYAKATVADKAGLIIFPDSYTHPGDVTAPASVNTAGAAYNSNSYDATAWGKMEAAGAVFLPAAGSRSVDTNNSVQGCGVIGGYWSSVVYSDDMAYSLAFQPSAIGPSVFNPKRFGASVRLVKDAN